MESLNHSLSMINFPDYEYFSDVDIEYSDFIQRITLVINCTFQGDKNQKVFPRLV